MTIATDAHPFEYAQEEHRRPSRDWRGWCLVFVRSCFGIAARYPSAAEAWRQAEHKHRTTDADSIPRGVPVFWLGGSGGFGHIALSRGDGTCWSTDFVRPGHVDVARIADIGPRWGMPLVGWTEDVNGVRVYTRPKPKAPPAPPAPPKPKTRGRNVDAALGSIRKALRHAAGRVRSHRLKTAREWLRKINRK